ncbi:TonB-dependent receptor plug domain-containing protein [Sandaracinus amylolyticus]|uniref:Outer membrane vitamin B12 receptor BtuB n=1 Tax=Sandaracinus amylolyticus TaxID=927083 RepID=A0A0F6W0G2_9BACT|nr:TonB-dependent receptor [Sandaracinus amylolyticus]AKF04318.1 Outer membrane vitamin B12 receptor BtuB [Sandaracinus amylolyticus]
MAFVRLVLAWWLVGSVVSCALARAQDGGDATFRARAEVERPIASRTPLDPTASSTRVEIDTTRVESMRDVLARVPGARALGTGAFGQPLGLSLRGADVAHSTVMLGDLPLTGPDLGAFDLGAIDLGSIAAIEVYRGGAPAMLGEGAIGGVIRLVPSRAEGRRAGASVSYGSFDTGIARAWGAVRGDGLSSLVALSFDAADNDHPFVDDGGTRLDPTDDRERARRNAGTRGASGLLHLEVPLDVGELEAVMLWVSRASGVPGAGSQLASEARRATDRYAGSVAYRLGGPSLSLEVMGGGWYGRAAFLDRLNELGTGQHASDDRQLRAFGRIAGSWSPVRELAVRALLTARHDRLEPDDPLVRTSLGASHRDGLVAVLEGAIDPRIDHLRIALRPSVRLEWSDAHLEQLELVSRLARSVEVIAPTFRLGAAIAPIAGIAISASIAHGTRIPSMIELFGDRATLVANVRLEPERATSIDAGVTVQERIVPGLELEAELRGFVSLAESLIRYRRTAQYTAVAENVASATIAGLELGVDLRALDHVRLEGALTFLDARDELGRLLPFRPQWHGFARVEASTGRALDRDVALSGFVSASYTAANAVDPANLVVIGDRTWIDLGARVALFGVIGISCAVRDLLDARGQDYLGLPLPGRRFVAQADIQGDL